MLSPVQKPLASNSPNRALGWEDLDPWSIQPEQHISLEAGSPSVFVIHRFNVQSKRRKRLPRRYFEEQHTHLLLCLLWFLQCLNQSFGDTRHLFWGFQTLCSEAAQLGSQLQCKASTTKFWSLSHPTKRLCCGHSKHVWPVAIVLQHTSGTKPRSWKLAYFIS